MPISAKSDTRPRPTTQARCDAHGFMKVLQIHSAPYTPTTGALGGSAITQVNCHSLLGLRIYFLLGLCVFFFLA